MKIEFLDDDLKRAKVTRGLFWREYAILVETDSFDRYGEDLELGFNGHLFWVWVFETTRRPVDRRISIKVHNAKARSVMAREDAARAAEWIRVTHA